jgi:tRNA threonylcarbamoyladenosine biosynthesis protein TsaE
MKRYSISHGRFKNLIHIDAYRLESGNELLKLGFQNMLSDKENLIVIEWPERVPFVIPSDATKIHFHFVDEKTREVDCIL